VLAAQRPAHAEGCTITVTHELLSHPGHVIGPDAQVWPIRPEAEGMESPIRTPRFADADHEPRCLGIKDAATSDPAPAPDGGEMFAREGHLDIVRRL
jgi:hypothetical protein